MMCCGAPKGMPPGPVEEWSAKDVRRWFEYKEFKYDSKLANVDGKRLLGMTERELVDILQSARRAHMVHYEFHTLAFKPDSLSVNPEEAVAAVAPEIRGTGHETPRTEHGARSFGAARQESPDVSNHDGPIDVASLALEQPAQGSERESHGSSFQEAAAGAHSQRGSGRFPEQPQGHSDETTRQ